MCGIAGMIAPDPETRINAALISIEHRGRDDEGVFVTQPFGANVVHDIRWLRAGQEFNL